MNPVLDTVLVAMERWPEEFIFWALFSILPIAFPVAIALLRRPRLTRPTIFALAAASRIIGYPALLCLLLVIPWVFFEIFLVPVIADAYPNLKTLMSWPLNVSNWLLWNAFWVVPLVWVMWVAVASYRYANSWQKQGK